MPDIKERLADYGLTLEPDVVICDRRTIDEAVSYIAELEAENERLTRELETAAKLKRQYLHAATHWHDKAEALSRTGAVKVPSEELCRYIDKCREMSNDGEYSWWSRLAEILSTLEPAAPEIGSMEAYNAATKAMATQMANTAISVGDGEPAAPEAFAYRDENGQVQFQQVVPESQQEAAEAERIHQGMERILREQSERDIPFAPVDLPAEQAVTEAMVEAGCKAFLAEYGDPSAKWQDYRHEITAALTAAQEAGR